MSNAASDDEAHLFIPLARETVEFLAREPDPLERIGKVVEMRQWVDDVLAEFVDEARRIGYGWDAIAGRLRVTRQAAWQRYHSRTEKPVNATSSEYLRADEIWSILTSRMRRGRWYDLAALYALVEGDAALTAADLDPDAPGSNSPRWQRNVRNVLQRRKSTGDLTWDGHARYRIP